MEYISILKCCKLPGSSIYSVVRLSDGSCGGGVVVDDDDYHEDNN